MQQMGVGRARDTHRREESSALLRAGLPDITSSLIERLPLNERELGALLVSDGLALAPLPLEDVARLYRSRGARVPFRIIQFGGMAIAVAPDAARATATMGAAAVRMVQHWGLVSVPALTDRIDALISQAVPEATVRRMLRALPGTRWLDGAGMGWFSFIDRPSGLGTALDKVFSIWSRVEMQDLREAVGKSLPAVISAPTEVLERYLIEVGGCSIQGHHVERAAEKSAEPISVAERTLVQILVEFGGAIDPPTLRRQAAEVALSDSSLTRLLKFSPLVLRGARDWIRLIGGERMRQPA